MHTVFPAYHYSADSSDSPYPSCDPNQQPANRGEVADVARPSLPRLVTVEEDAGDAGAPLDQDQIASELFLSSPSASHLFSSSAPEPIVLSPAASQDADISSSPAAMFLASFSPVVQSTSAPSFAPDDEGQVVAGYTLGPIIARGGFSVIRRASSAAGGTVAVKIVRRSEISKQPDAALVRKKLEREAETWASLSHEHILPLFASSHTAFADFFVMPYCPAGTLFDILSREGRPGLPPDDAGMLFRQVVRGLRYLHETAEIVHRDMKLENVLVDESGICRIADFGMARRIGEAGEDEEDVIASSQSMSLPAATAAAASTLLRRKSTLAPRALRERMQQHARRKASNPLPSSAVPQAHQAYESGSLPYAAPELLIPHERALPADPAQDIWALGVMLYALLVGRLPFMDSFEPRLQMKILHGVYERVPSIGAEAERVIDGCLERDVDERWTIAMVDDVAWGVGWNSVVEPPYEPEAERRSRHPSRVQRRSLSRCPIASRSCSRDRPPSLSPERRRRRSPPDSLGPTSPRRSSLSASQGVLASPVSATGILSPTTSLSSTFSTSLSLSDSQERTEARQRSESRSPLPPTPTDSTIPLPSVDRGRKGFRGELGSVSSPLVRELVLGIREEKEPIEELALPEAEATAVPVDVEQSPERGRRRRPTKRAGTSVSVPARQPRGRSHGHDAAPWLMGDNAGWNPSPSRPAPPVEWNADDTALPTPKLSGAKGALRSKSVGFELRRAPLRRESDTVHGL